ncbi:UBP-type zinc finger domain-containing protein [Nocardioides sp. CER19]|uniref:UBP-type zinc finger domain-containing protein n=1 Tax=Nocardioides sp. CER19 TaxID=3038538 RepID=UPI002448A883|nr:UBP-type zinc finger domain-containing protein [Nocardioides sp. CER19]MDH2415602.1 UBP-type zinc finger domain-containing protein [Nocardioides sp. CER19]
MSDNTGIDVTAAPSGTGCAECEQADGWWLHLRRCAQCGHVGCCDSSPGQHASGHAAATGHPYVQSFEPGETWFWDYGNEDYAEGPVLADPQHHPADQAVPGPAERVPSNWRELLH